MLSFRTKNAIPPGGLFFFKVEETDQYFEHPSEEILLRDIRSHYAANGFEVPENLQEVVRDYICRHAPESFCRGHSSLPRALILSPLKIREFTRILYRKVKNLNEDLCSLEEAEARARICGGCDMNLKHYCTTCNGLGAFRKILIGNRKTPRDWDLGVCGACSCLLGVKIHMSKKVLEGARDFGYPDHCWMKPFLKPSEGSDG